MKQEEPIIALGKLVKDIYESKNPKRDEWADWLYQNHVLWVAATCRELATRFGAKPDLAEAAGLVHDIADAIMPRKTIGHEEKSLQLASDLMKTARFTDSDIDIVINDAARYHSCRGEDRPKSIEGKCLATADAMAHFKTEFYFYAFSAKRFEDYQTIKVWVSKKVDKEFNNKIFFDEIKREIEPYYITLKTMSS